MSNLRTNKVYFTTVSAKASYVLLPLLGILSTANSGWAQVVAAEDGTSTVVNTMGDRIDITGGQRSGDGANLFQSFEQFDVSAEQTANFVTSPEVQNVIGRVTDPSGSFIDGTLAVSGSDANLYLMNPAGILMGPNAQLNLPGSFTATSATGVEFADGQYTATTTGDYSHLTGSPTALQFGNRQAGAVANTGDLTVTEGEAITLVGGTVVNTGSISAPTGTVTIAAVEGENLVRISQDNQLLSLEVEAIAPTDTISEGIRAQSQAQSIGEMLTGGALSNATALITEADGSVRLGNEILNESGGSAIAAGSISVEGDLGGNINVLGDRVALIDAHLNASGTEGGGAINVGGSYQGQGELFNAAETVINAGSTLLASATENGDGGQVIVWADETTDFYGSIAATGGLVQGHGGFAEVSGRNQLTFAGSTDLSAPNGDTGTLLLDPLNWVITDGAAPPNTATTSYISSADVEALSTTANVNLAATNDFTIEDLSDNVLLFQNGRSITFTADSDLDGNGAFVMLGTDDRIDADGGDINISGAGITVSSIGTDTIGNGITSGGSITLISSQDVTVNSLSTNVFFNGNNSGNGGNIRIEANGGDIVINDRVSTWSDATGNNAGAGGDITLSASGSITTAELDTRSSADRNNSQSGGTVQLTAATGDITVTDRIRTGSIALGNNSSRGGDITLSAPQGNISTRSISSESRANNNAEAGGNIDLTAGGTIQTEQLITASSVTNDRAGNGGNVTISANDFIGTRIETFSIADDDEAGNGGTVNINAVNNITITDLINTESRDSDDESGNAGQVTLAAGNTLQANSITATHSGGGNDADISLTGDRIELLGGNNSVNGETVSVIPTNVTTNINIGKTTAQAGASPDLSLSIRELAAIGTNDTITLGRADSTGTIRLFDGITAPPNNTISINLLGGSTLIGPNTDTTFEMSSFSAGRIQNTGFRFAEIESFDGGGGFNTLSYQNITGLSEIQLPVVSNFQRLIGPAGVSTLRGPDTNNTWLITDTNQGSINGLAFEDFSTLRGGNQNDTFRFQMMGSLDGGITGGPGNDTLDYSNYLQQPVTIDVESMSATGLGTTFDSIENIIGTTGANDEIRGTSGNDTFNITGDRTGTFTSLSTSTLNFSNIDRLNGQAGTNTFVLNGLTAPTNITVIGGSDLMPLAASNNRITTDIGNTTWTLTDINQGRLQQGNTTLASFREIQSLESTSTAGGEHTVLFTTGTAQITGGITSGSSDLALIGDDINIGHSNQNGIISGTGKLTIRPTTNNINIELGGANSLAPQTLNITTGELEAIQNGFSEIVIGGEDQTGQISLGGDVEFRDAVTVRSQGRIDTTGGQILGTEADSNLTLRTGSDLLSGSLRTAGSNITLAAEQDITLDTVATTGTLNGQGININSQTGNIRASGDLTANGAIAGNNITVTAPETIEISGNISTSGGDRGGDVRITAANGSLTTRDINTSNLNAGGSKPGDVTLSSADSLQVNVIDASGTGTDAASTRVDIDTSTDFIANFNPANTLPSISSAGTGTGAIRIRYGTGDRPANSFSVNNNATTNGTGHSIVSGSESLTSGLFTENYGVEAGSGNGTIQLINRGLQVALAVAEGQAAALAPAPAPIVVATPPTLEVSAAPSISLNRDEDLAGIFNQLETGNSQAFSEYLSLSKRGPSAPVATIGQVQDTLSSVANTTGVNPALVYAYFVPDAAEIDAVVSGSDRPLRPTDQLEVMVISPTGSPVRQRRWGITRAQVEEASRELRRQATSQFSTSRQYLPPAQQLYDWMIGPIAPVLEAQNIGSLGFVLDVGLRTLPLAALHDGDRFLVENYSLGLLPTFSLTDFDDINTDRIDFQDVQVLAMGASEFADQPALPAVRAEVKLIADQFGNGEAFLNEDFVLENLQTQLQSKDYDVLHLATHADFVSGELDSSYIQLWDDKLSLNELNSLGLNQTNLGLIILSACSTALGDEASEYGFAGFAVGAGSQSALASVWPVNDEGTLGFMTQFYNQLADTPLRADALRQAQLTLISGQVGISDGLVYGPNDEILAEIPELANSGRWDFSHPFYWSPFTMIGNPW